jgi:D-sedoheptulose 7-phosphate isomerase
MNDITCIQENYRSSIEKVWKRIDWNAVKFLSNDLFEALNSKSKIFLCGNGGSASNANHLANDLLYGISSNNRKGLKVHSLTANVAVNTCLANDRGYENIFSDQLITLADKNDILIVFSGSGNSLNVVEAMHKANAIGMKTHAILGFDGGKCKDIAGNAIHIPIDNMQIAEDFQMMIGHILMLDLKGRN